MIERAIRGGAKASSRFAFLKMLFTFSIVVLAWIFFRANTVQDAFFIVTHLFVDWRDYLSPNVLAVKFRGTGLQLPQLKSAITFIVLLLAIEWSMEKQWFQKIMVVYPFVKWLFYLTLLAFILFWGSGQAIENFIYFQF